MPLRHALHAPRHRASGVKQGVSQLPLRVVSARPHAPLAFHLPASICHVQPRPPIYQLQSECLPTTLDKSPSASQPHLSTATRQCNKATQTPNPLLQDSLERARGRAVRGIHRVGRDGDRLGDQDGVVYASAGRHDTGLRGEEQTPGSKLQLAHRRSALASRWPQPQLSTSVTSPREHGARVDDG